MTVAYPIHLRSDIEAVLSRPGMRAYQRHLEHRDLLRRHAEMVRAKRREALLHRARVVWVTICCMTSVPLILLASLAHSPGMSIAGFLIMSIGLPVDMAFDRDILRQRAIWNQNWMEVARAILRRPDVMAALSDAAMIGRRP